ncbi:MAG TPA: four helix bundle protein [Gemmatimonadaceae bacterium]|nr:four helix bundle protein [Gemmatimonadaceae bacterium]
MAIPTNGERSVRDLIVWQKAMAIAEQVYAVTHQFPPDERFGLVAQCRRAAVSIAANIAEGHGRRSTAFFIHFLRIARGSVSELDTELELA